MGRSATAALRQARQVRHVLRSSSPETPLVLSPHVRRATRGRNALASTAAWAAAFLAPRQVAAFRSIWHHTVRRLRLDWIAARYPAPALAPKGRHDQERLEI